MEFFNIELFNLSLSLLKNSKFLNCKSEIFDEIEDFTLAYFKILNMKYFNATLGYVSENLGRVPYIEFRVYDSFGKLDITQIVVEFINGVFKARLEKI